VDFFTASGYDTPRKVHFNLTIGGTHNWFVQRRFD